MLNNIRDRGLFLPLFPFLTNRDCRGVAQVNKVLAYQVKSRIEAIILKNEGSRALRMILPVKRAELHILGRIGEVMSAALYVVKKQAGFMSKDRDDLTHDSLSPETLMGEFFHIKSLLQNSIADDAVVGDPDIDIDLFQWALGADVFSDQGRGAVP